MEPGGELRHANQREPRATTQPVTYHRVVPSREPTHATAANPNPADEPLDVLDAAGNPTGTVKARGQVHLDGDWHRALHIWVVRGDDMVLLQRRALGKDLEPGKLDVSVGGHYRSGELFIDALREAEEELGLVLRPGQVEYLTTVRSERHYPQLNPPVTDREFQEVYVVRDARPLHDYRLPQNEVDTVYELPIDKAITLFEAGQYAAAAGFDAMRRPSNALLHEDDLPSQGRELHAAALKLVQKWLEGELSSEIPEK